MACRKSAGASAGHMHAAQGPDVQVIPKAAYDRSDDCGSVDCISSTRVRGFRFRGGQARMKTIDSGQKHEQGHKHTGRSRPAAQARRGDIAPWGSRAAVPLPPAETPAVLQRKLAAAFGRQERGQTFPRWQSNGEAEAASPQATAHDAATAATEGVPSAVAPAAVVQRKGGAEHPRTLEIAAEGVHGPGQALPHLQRLQQSFGPHDLSGVRSFAGDQATTAARQIGAEAYTLGDRVAFRDGNPSLHTVAHEAAHVIQQRAGVQLKGGVGQAGDVYERHADAVADAVVSGRSAAPLLAQSPTARPAHSPAQPAAVQRIKAEDMGTLMALAELEAPGFHSLMKKVAADSNAEYKYRKGLKSASRTLVKAKEYEKGLKDDTKAELHGVESMVDMIAGSLVFKSLAGLAAGYNTLRTALDGKGAEIVRVKNRIEKAHLRDFLLNIKMPSGFIVELQLHLAPTIDAKMGKSVKVDADSTGKGGHTKYTGHDAYDYQRILDPFLTIVKDVKFTAYIDPSDQDEKYELAQERTLLRYMEAGTDGDLSAYLKLEPYKKKTEEDLSKLTTELNTLYSNVMNELMTKAWSSISSKKDYASDLELVKSIQSVDAIVRQDLATTRSYWPTKPAKSLGGKDATESARKKELNRLIKWHKTDAQTALNASDSGDAGTVKLLKDLYKDLNSVRSEKKTKHPDTVKEPASIDTLLSHMKKIVSMVERQADVEKIVKRVKQKARDRKRRAERAKTKEAEAKAKAATGVTAPDTQ